MGRKPIEGSINSLIWETLEGMKNPDPREVVRIVLDLVSDEDYRRLAEKGLTRRVNEALSGVRLPASRRKSQAVATSARWDAVANQQASGALDISRYAVFTGTSRKWLPDCTYADLIGASDYHKEKEEAHAITAQGFRKLANYLKKEGKEVVGELVDTKVAGYLDA